MDVPMELSRILITELGDQQVIFLREKNGQRSFPILIGIAEALAIDRRLKKKPMPRPMTHDLLANVIEKMGGRLEKIVINDLREHTFIATIYISRDGEVISIDSRPSDAIALGVAFDTPIFVSDRVLSAVLSGPASVEEQVEMLRRRQEVLREKIAELEQMLADDDFLANASPSLRQRHRRGLEELKSEYHAISMVLKKLG